MAYAHKPDHQDEGVSFLLWQFENSPRLQALVRVLLSPFQELEDAVPGLRAAFDLNTITQALVDDVFDDQNEEITSESGAGVWTDSSNGQQDRLSRLGPILGEERNGRMDSEYLAYVIARVLINRSKGEPSDIYKVARALLGTTNNTLRLEGLYPAAYRLYVGGNQIEYPWDPTVPAAVVGSALADMLLEATGGGIGLEVHFQTADNAHTFTLSSDPAEPQTDADRGFANDVGTQGGRFIGVEIRT